MNTGIRMENKEGLFIVNNQVAAFKILSDIDHLEATGIWPKQEVPKWIGEIINKNLNGYNNQQAAIKIAYRAIIDFFIRIMHR